MCGECVRVMYDFFKFCEYRYNDYNCVIGAGKDVWRYEVPSGSKNNTSGPQNVRIFKYAHIKLNIGNYKYMIFSIPLRFMMYKPCLGCF